MPDQLLLYTAVAGGYITESGNDPSQRHQTHREPASGAQRCSRGASPAAMGHRWHYCCRGWGSTALQRSVTLCSTCPALKATSRKISQLGNRNTVHLFVLTRLSTATAGHGSEIGRSGWILRARTCSAASPIDTRVASSCAVVYPNQPRENEKHSPEFINITQAF